MNHFLNIYFEISEARTTVFENHHFYIIPILRYTLPRRPLTHPLGSSLLIPMVINMMLNALMLPACIQAMESITCLHIYVCKA